MRLVSSIVAGAILTGALGGCASVSGLDQFTSGGCVDGCNASLEQGGSSDDAGIPDSVNDATIATDDTMSADVVEWPDSANAGEQGPTMIEEGGGRDSGADSGDGGNHQADAGTRGDAGTEGGGCSPQTCSSGCCDDHGNCTVTSASTCGTGGVSCKDCQTSGQVCSGGSCATLDAGGQGPTCTPSTCLNLCVPYFHQCCTATETCGCSINFPPGPCQ